MLYPVFYKLEGKVVVVVGGGRIAAEKLRSLSGTGARIIVISPTCSDDCQSLITSLNATLIREQFRNTFHSRPVLVIAATDHPAINRKVRLLANALRIPINVADQKVDCDWYNGAVVRRGDLTVAISGNGQAPALLSWLRKELERILAENEGDFLDALAVIRSELILLKLSPAERTQWFYQCLDILKSGRIEEERVYVKN